MVLFGSIELNQRRMPTYLHINYLVLHLLHQHLRLHLRTQLLQVYYLESTGQFAAVVETEENLPEGSLSQLHCTTVREALSDILDLQLLHSIIISEYYYAILRPCPPEL